MYALESIKNKLISQLNSALRGQAEVSSSELVFPPDGKMGDISLPCFALGKKLGQPPFEIAQGLAAALNNQAYSVRADGPYLNFQLNKSFLAGEVLSDIGRLGDKYGHHKSGQRRKVLVEFANQNTHKEVHVGHVRNFSYGDSVYRLLKANGFAAIPFSYINDFGINTARVIWGLRKFYADYKIVGDKSEFLGKLYSEATKKMEELGETAKAEVASYMQQIESRQGEIYEQWQETRSWNIEGFKKIYRELGIRHKETWYESELIAEGLRLVSDLQAKGILKESQGAIIADLEEFGLGIQVYLRSDGTALYPVADLVLARAKVEKFGIDESIIVVDIRQALHFKQLFKVMELMGYKQKMIHLGYDFVTLPSGAMSSRTGNVITYASLKKALLEKAIVSTKEKHPDWPARKIRQVAKQIAIGAMKFEMIKVGREKIITFEVEKSLRFDGFTAAYLQYTGARINSVLKKSGFNKEAKPEFLVEPKEHELLVKLVKYPDIVSEAGNRHEPSEVAKYLFELAQLFNDYYHSVPVLKTEAQIKAARLSLLSATKQVLANGLDLLGIDFIEEM